MVLVQEVYTIARTWPDQEKFGLVSQAQRASVSIACNIAEGAGRQTRKEFINFLHIAQGSLSELDTLLEIAHTLGYPSSNATGILLEEISKMITGLIRSLHNGPKEAEAGPGPLGRTGGVASTALSLLLAAHCLLLTFAGCVPKAKGKTTTEVYQDALAEGVRDVVTPLEKEFKMERPLGYEEPVVPVMIPPETILVWFAPQRVGKDVFVNGHWVQLVVRGWEWNPEILSNPVPAVPGARTVPLPLHPESKPKEPGGGR